MLKDSDQPHFTARITTRVSGFEIVEGHIMFSGVDRAGLFVCFDGFDVRVAGGDCVRIPLDSLRAARRLDERTCDLITKDGENHSAARIEGTIKRLTIRNDTNYKTFDFPDVIEIEFL